MFIVVDLKKEYLPIKIKNKASKQKKNNATQKLRLFFEQFYMYVLRKRQGILAHTKKEVGDPGTHWIFKLDVLLQVSFRKTFL